MKASYVKDSGTGIQIEKDGEKERETERMRQGAIE